MGKLSRYSVHIAFVLVAAAAALGAAHWLRQAGRSVAPEMDLSPRAALERAEWAHVYRVQPKIEIPITPIGPGADENPGMFTMLKAGTRFGAEAPPGEPDLVIAIRSRAPRAEHGRVTRLQYDLETGRVGHGDEWGQTPPAFRAWMRVADSRVPRREYGIARSEGRKVIAPLPEQSPDGTAP